MSPFFSSFSVVFLSLFRAFSAYEEKVPVDHELEHRERTNLEEYKSKYTKHNTQDPLTLLIYIPGYAQNLTTDLDREEHSELIDKMLQQETLDIKLVA